VNISVGNLAFTTTDMTFVTSLSRMVWWTRSRSLLIATPAPPKVLASWQCPTAPRRKSPLSDSKARSWRAVSSRSMQRSRVPHAMSPADPAGKSRVCEVASFRRWPLLWWEESPGNARLGTAAHHHPTPRRCAEVRRRLGALTRDAMLEPRSSAWQLSTGKETATCLARGVSMPHSPRRSTE
jgi:hypothetical protein